MAKAKKPKLSSEEKEDVGHDAKSARYWHKQLQGAFSREERFRKVGDQVVARYMDDREHYEAEPETTRRVNILWATTEVQKGMLFSRLGKPDVSRLFPKPGKDNKVARASALVIERSLVACANRYDPDFEITEAIEDQLLPGRGICWLVYEPVFETVTITVMQVDEETGAEVEVEQSEERIKYQSVRFEHVEWKDFRHGGARTWRQVPWVARPLICTVDDLKRDYPEHADKIKLTYVLEEGRDLKEPALSDYKRARLWEIWDKNSKSRIIVADDYEYELSRVEDPYRLQDFFPVARPLYGVKTSSSLCAKAEFLQWEDQAAELDRCNTRIWKLVEELKYTGVYDASDAENKENFLSMAKAKDGQFIGIKNLHRLAQGGGLEKAFQVKDIAPIAAAIQAAAQRAEQCLAYIYEVTGISDLMRGATNAMETATAQDHKARYGSQRQQQKQREVQRFVRDLYRMKAEIIAEHFEREVLAEMSGIQLPTQAEIEEAKKALQALQRAQQQVQQAQQAAQQGQPVQPPADALALLQMAQQDPDQIAEWQETVKAVAWDDIAAVLRSDDRRNYKIDVETDMTAFDETVEEKKQRIEFMQVFGQLLPGMIQASTGNPVMAAMNREMLMTMIRPFKVSRTFEESIDDAFTKVAQMQPQPTPEQAEAAKASKLADLEIQNQTLELEGRKMKNTEMELKNKQIEAQALTSAAEIERKKQMDDRDYELKKRELDIREFEVLIKLDGVAVDAVEASGQIEAGGGEANPVGEEGSNVIRPSFKGPGIAGSRLFSDIVQRLSQQNDLILQHMTARKRVIRDANGDIAEIVTG